MTKRELFNLILNTTADVCEVAVSEILDGKRTMDVVDARCIAMHYLRKYGLTTRDILRLFGRNNLNSVNSIVSAFEVKHSQSFCFRSNEKEIRKILESKLPE